jgi:hypothetical protein
MVVIPDTSYSFFLGCDPWIDGLTTLSNVEGESRNSRQKKALPMHNGCPLIIIDLPLLSVGYIGSK